MDTLVPDPNILDLAGLLPPASRTKLERLVEERDAAHAAFSAADDRAHEAYRELVVMENAVARKVSDRRYAPHGGMSTQDYIAFHEKPLAPKRAEVERLSKAADRLEVRWEAFAVIDELRFWLGDARIRQTRFAHHPLPAVKVKNHVEAVEKLRAELDTLDAAWAAAEAAPAPAADLRERMMTAVDEIAQRGQPNLDPRIRDGDPLRLAREFSITTNGRGSIFGHGGAPLLVWLFKDEITDRLGKLIEATPQKGVLTDTERVRRFEEIADRRLQVEREEEALISAAAEAGQIVARRRDADPRAVLEIEEIA